jgi:general secretion pathway protein G
MIETIRELNKRRSASEENQSGFTLIELLIVIVVLGILAAIVVFALSGVTGQSTTAACQSDAKTVGIGVAALQAENPDAIPTATGTFATSTATSTPQNWSYGLISGTLTGGPFLQSWPTGNAAFYSISVAGTGAAATTGDAVTPANGDVIVTAKSSGLTYDATVNPVSACKSL